MTQGRVKVGVTGFHPGMQADLIPGEVYAVPDGMWSDILFEPLEPVVEATPEPPPVWRRSRPATDAVKED